MLKWRYLTQCLILLIVLYSGIAFYFYISDIEQGIEPSFDRPPSVEGFLPIGGLMSLKLFVAEGVLDTIHPAAAIILAASVTVSFVFRKSFCSWICPIGTLSEAIWKIGKKIMAVSFNIQKYIDYTLRSIKYLLLGFFTYIILWQMSSSEILEFFNTPYWKVADVKMLKFFTDMTQATAVTLLILLLLSFIYKNFWCRYLCPYGALVGLFSLVGPTRIIRYNDACIHCGKCYNNCPAQLPIDKLKSVNSAECTACFSCVSVCPKKDALFMTFAGKYRIDIKNFAIMLLVLFFGIVMAARISGYWQSSISAEELRYLIPKIKEFHHP